MPVVAYLANIFPASVEPYVREEIVELRKRSVAIVPCGILPADAGLCGQLKSWADETVYLRPLRLGLLLRAGMLCVLKFGRFNDLFLRALQRRNSTEGRLAALAHTVLGVYLALLLRDRRVEHIHVHHGYFGSWVAMVAARVLDIPFSMTLHGSDLLLHAAYLDIKLRECQFAVTISEFNRRHILATYPDVDPAKLYVQRLGVDCRMPVSRSKWSKLENSPLRMLAVGRLHPVKNHAFLLQACHLLKSRGTGFVCLIAGDGPERPSLEKLIADLDLEREVHLLGNLTSHEVHEQYEKADVIVLTSRSEGIPLVLMEAMAQGKIVLAPQITGIPELVVDGITGFLYRPGSLEDFVSRAELIDQTRAALSTVRENARAHIVRHFDRDKNLAAFCELFLEKLGAKPVRISIPA
jgi:colanic acid/amylovoran biosynthesis glycosyltransferase